MADILTRVAEYVNKIPTGEARPSVRRKLYEDLAKLEVKAALADAQWIRVDERLPDKAMDVLFVASLDAFGGRRVLGGRWHPGEHGGFGIPGLVGLEATHWMPSPLPPDGE